MSECNCNCNCGPTTTGSSCSDGCVTNSAPSSVYACTGASNVGIISLDLTVALHKAGKYKMGCATCIGAGDCSCGSDIDPAAPKDLLIDGCAASCLKKMFDKQGKTHYNHVIVTQLGVKKEATFDYDRDLLPVLIDKIAVKGF